MCDPRDIDDLPQEEQDEWDDFVISCLSDMPTKTKDITIWSIDMYPTEQQQDTGHLHSVDDDQEIQECLSRALWGDSLSLSCITEAASESDHLVEFLCTSVPLDFSQWNYKDLPDNKKDQFLSAAAALYADIITYLRRLDLK